jgi:hypothetical protein
MSSSERLAPRAAAVLRMTRFTTANPSKSTMQTCEARRLNLGPKEAPHGVEPFVSIVNAFGTPDVCFGHGTAKGPLTELMV